MSGLEVYLADVLITVAIIGSAFLGVKLFVKETE